MEPLPIDASGCFAKMRYGLWEVQLLQPPPFLKPSDNLHAMLNVYSGGRIGMSCPRTIVI